MKQEVTIGSCTIRCPRIGIASLYLRVDALVCSQFLSMILFVRKYETRPHAFAYRLTYANKFLQGVFFSRVSNFSHSLFNVIVDVVSALGVSGRQSSLLFLFSFNFHILSSLCIRLSIIQSRLDYFIIHEIGLIFCIKRENWSLSTF